MNQKLKIKDIYDNSTQICELQRNCLDSMYSMYSAKNLISKSDKIRWLCAELECSVDYLDDEGESEESILEALELVYVYEKLRPIQN